MLVAVTRRSAEVSKERVVLAVGDDLDGQVAAKLEPLGAFSPVGESDVRLHSGVVAASAEASRVVEGADEAEIGVEEVGVDGGEVEERDAGFREEDEPLVREIEECIC